MPTASEYRSGRVGCSRHSVVGGTHGGPGRSVYRTTTTHATTGSSGVRKGGSRQSIGVCHHEATRHGCTGGGGEDEFRLPALPNLIAIHKRQGEEGLRTALDNFPLDIYIDGIDNLHAQVAKLQRQCNQMEFALVTWQSYMHAVMNYVEQHQSCDPLLPSSEPAPPTMDHSSHVHPPPTPADYVDNHRAASIEFPYKMTSLGTSITVPRLSAPVPQPSTAVVGRDVNSTDMLASNLPGPMNSIGSVSIPPGLPRAPTNESRIPVGPLLPPLTLSVEERGTSHSQPNLRSAGGSFTQPSNPNRLQQRPQQRSAGDGAHHEVESVAEMHLNAHIDSLRAIVTNPDLDESIFLHPAPSWGQRSQDEVAPNTEFTSDRSDSSGADAENVAPRANAAVNKQSYQKASTESPSAAGKNSNAYALRKQQSMESDDEGRQTGGDGGEIASAVESYRADLYRESALSAQSSAAQLGEGAAILKQHEKAPPEDLGASHASSDSGYVFPTKVQMSKQQRPSLVPSLALERTGSHKSAWLQGEYTNGDFYAT